MTSAPAESADRPRSPGREAAVRAALVPVGACAAALLLLCAYTATGAAGGSPAAVRVGTGRIFHPAGSGSATAYFPIRNTGGAEDVLESVSSLDLGVTVLTRTGGDGVRRTGPVTVPAGDGLRMGPSTVGVQVLDPPPLELGKELRFDLWFRASGQIRATAVAVRPE